MYVFIFNNLHRHCQRKLILSMKHDQLIKWISPVIVAYSQNFSFFIFKTCLFLNG